MVLGLSPPVRGNQTRRSVMQRGDRSIPACAGEPSRARPRRQPPPVYPRLCGGTRLRMPSGKSGSGLSPPVRGNRERHSPRRRGLWSIPACAGEPLPCRLPPSPIRVYPRLCGGTSWGMIDFLVRYGLSPPVRGNPPQPPKLRRRQRSIPACAGEPQLPPETPPPDVVYPRLCGGTQPPLGRNEKREGLSPPVRGNRQAV